MMMLEIKTLATTMLKNNEIMMIPDILTLEIIMLQDNDAGNNDAANY